MLKRIKLGLLLVLTIVTTTYGQNTKENIVFDHMALSVKHLDNSVRFYKDIVGLHEITNKTKQDNIRWFSLGNSKELHLIQGVEGKVDIKNKAVHFALKVKNFDSFKRHIQANKIVFFNWNGEKNKVGTRPDGVRQIYFRDPDNYLIEIND